MADSPSRATGPGQSPVTSKGGSFGFLSTSTGRMVLAGVALFVVVVAVGAIAFFFLLSGGSSKQTPPAPVASITKSTITTPAAVPVSPPEAPLDETFTFRNIFAPSVSPHVAPTSASTGGSGSSETSGTGGGSGEANTLILKSITRDSGERVARFSWNGAEYDVKEGEQVDSSPWQVITIYSDSVLMLYGDTKITLSVGQGFAGDSSSK